MSIKLLVSNSIMWAAAILVVAIELIYTDIKILFL